MRKVVFIVSSLRRSGPIIVLQNIVRNLDNARYQAEIIKLLDDEPQRSITHEFISLGIPVHEMHLTKLKVEIQSMRVARLIDSLLKSIQPDIIHTHGYQAVIVASKLEFRCPKIETLHCISKEDFTMSKGYFMGSYMNYRYLSALKRIDGAAAISQAVENYYIACCHSLKVRCIYNGVQLPETDFAKNKAYYRASLGIPSEDKLFVVVASLSERKDPLVIIRAFQMAFPINLVSNVKLVFLGKGTLMDECKRQIGDDSRIKLAGWQPNVYDYLAAADYSISASHSEGFGLNFIESLAIGTPVIATDIPAFKEFFALYPPLKQFEFEIGNEKMLADKMRLAANTSINIRNVTADVSIRFADKTMAENYMAFYDELTLA